MVKIKRVYEPAAKTDGYRVLVDRLWPRGIKKSDLVMDEWLKELAPSTDLRKRFAHEPEKWHYFVKSYLSELRAAGLRSKIQELAARARRGTVTLIYSAKDEEHNNALVLKDLITNSTRRVAQRTRAGLRRAAA